MNDLIQFQEEVNDETASIAIANVIHGIELTNKWIKKLYKEVNRIHGKNAKIFLYTGLSKNKLEVKIQSEPVVLGERKQKDLLMKWT